MRLLTDGFADADLVDSRMGNEPEIMSRCYPSRDHASTFGGGEPDPRLIERLATCLILLPRRRQTIRALVNSSLLSVGETELNEHDS